MKNDINYWINRWQKSKNFRVENDRIKPRSYLFSSFSKTNLYGFQDGNLRPVLVGDFFSRYQRMVGFNVLYPIGYDSLGMKSFMENKKHSNSINDDISLIFKDQMLKLGIGIDSTNEIDLKHDEYVSLLQLAFVDLYEAEYIKYGNIDVYQTKDKKKIFDTYFKNNKLYPNRVKAFYLDIENSIDNIVSKINELNTSKDIKNSLLNMLEPKRKITIQFMVTNGKILNIEFENPQYIGGISYIMLHPDYFDLSEYVLFEEYEAVEKYFLDDSNNDFGVFSGNYAINPLTGKQIPIFISINHECPIFASIPFIDEEEYEIAVSEGLPAIDIVQDGVLIESDFLNGLTVEDARNTLIDRFEEAEIGVSVEYYSKKKILLSSLDSFGALLPFLVDGDKVYSLKKHLPFVFSSKFRPVLSEKIDVPGEVIEGSINHLFSTGLLPILAMMYDNIGASISIFSKEAISLFNQWNSIELLCINKNELFEYIFMPCVILGLIEKEKNVCLPPLFKELVLVNETFDDNYLKFEKSKNEVFMISNYLNEYRSDSLRLYFLSKPLNQDFIFSLDELESLNNIVKSIEEFYDKDFIGENNLNSDFDELVNKCNTLLYEKRVDDYINSVIDFYKVKLWKESLTYSQGLKFLKLLYPFMPFLAEDIYSNVFSGRYLISDDGWI